MTDLAFSLLIEYRTLAEECRAQWNALEDDEADEKVREWDRVIARINRALQMNEGNKP